MLCKYALFNSGKWPNLSEDTETPFNEFHQAAHVELSMSGMFRSGRSLECCKLDVCFRSGLLIPFSCQ